MKTKAVGFLLSALLCLATFDSSVARASAAGVAGVVSNDGAQVYDRPDFDGKVLGKLHEGRKVRVSKGVTGRRAKFHKIKVGKHFGYISSMDVSVAGDRTPASARSKGVTGGSIHPEKSSGKHRKHGPSLPVFYSQFFGLAGGMVKYHGSAGGVDADTNLLIYGIKFTGPNILFNGPVVDFNIDLHYGAPSYYESVSSIQPTGYILMTDALFMLPFLQRQDFTGLFGVGPVLSYASFRLFNGTQSQDVSEFHFGASFMAGFVYRMGEVALRAEGKYYLVKNPYPGALLSIQTGF